MNQKTCSTIVPYGATQAKHFQQLCLALEPPQIKPEAEYLLHGKRHKPQITSIPGISPKQRNRYRVVLGREILGERLTLDEALKLAKGGEG